MRYFDLLRLMFAMSRRCCVLHCLNARHRPSFHLYQPNDGADSFLTQLPIFHGPVRCIRNCGCVRMAEQYGRAVKSRQTPVSI
jgi:hypothetical protein